MRDGRLRPASRHRAELHRSAVAGVEAITLASAHSFPRHSHDQYGVGVIDRGAQRSWSGVGPVEAGPGDVITANPGEVHDGAPLDRVGGRAWRMVYLDPELVAREAGDAAEAPPVRFEIARPVMRDTVLARRFGRLFAAATGGRDDPLAREEALLALVAHLGARHGAVPAPRAATPPPVALARARIDADPAAPVTLAELAALAGVSRFQILRAFARELGLTPRAYVLQRRLSLARRLIAGGGRLADVAAAAGFADQSHMTRTFVGHLGVTPGRYAAALA